jgi:hypothetical protein
MNVYIVGCAKNCGKYIAPVFENIAKMSAFFDDVRIVIAVGKSTDDTVATLISMRAKYSHLSITLISDPEGEKSPIRPARIAAGRNALMRHIRKTRSEGGKQWTHMVMLDMDNVASSPMDTEVFRDTLRRDSEWDAVSFNAPVYYDIWALSYKPYTVSCWNWGANSRNVVHFMMEDIKARLGSMNPEELFSCNSAFNGLAIYKLDKFMECTYDHITVPYDDLDGDDLEYSVGFFRHVLRDAKAGYFRPMQDQDCEHRAFHEEARTKYGARVRISPKILFPEMKV